MKIVGIVCEYNPFHLGHMAQMEKIRGQFGDDCAVVCAMSGYFVQRGEPACMDPYTRAAAAAACGADLVLMLPVGRSLSSAEGFCRGGVELLDRLGCVDALSFGCESADASSVLLAAKTMERPDFEQHLREKLKEGLSYAAAKQQALETLTGVSGILRTPNDILGAEYCRGLLRRHSTVCPAPIHRPGSYHDTEADPGNPSATAVRRLLETDAWQPYVPPEAVPYYKDAPLYCLAAGERAVLARLRAMTQEEWERVPHGSEGLWRKVRSAVREKNTLEEILEASRSKRYPMTRLQRLLLCAYLGLTAEDLTRSVDSVRILAMSEKGRAVVRLARKQGDLVLRNPGEKAADPHLQELERRTADLFSLFAREFSRGGVAMENTARLNF